MMRFLLLLLLLSPVAVQIDDLLVPRFADASAAENDKADMKKDKRSERRKRVEKETETWVEQIQEEDRKRREEEEKD